MGLSLCATASFADRALVAEYFSYNPGVNYDNLDILERNVTEADKQVVP